MAINPSIEFPGKVTPPTPEFPYASAKDVTAPGAGDGTPYVKRRADDIFGFQQALLTTAGIVPSGIPDTALESEYLKSLKFVAGKNLYSAEIDYETNSQCLGSDGIEYESMSPNGPGTAVIDPVGDLTGTWKYLDQQIIPISASVAANSMTIKLSPTTLDFRNVLLTDGSAKKRDVENEISLILSNGSTLGTISTIKSRIMVIAIDNAGTVELAAVNLAGGNNLDETTIISTTAEGGGGGADSANVIYSATARASVAFRVVGFIDSTQPVAGAWSTQPTLVQGSGGLANASLGGLGYQTWQDVTLSRSLGVTYYNTTGRPIFMVAAIFSDTDNSARLLINGSVLLSGTTVSGLLPLWGRAMFAIIPPGNSYLLDVTIPGISTVHSWEELR